MTFDFLCPHGHPLKAEISQQGRRIHCPQCGVQFAVPFLHQHGPHEPAAPSAAPADPWNPAPPGPAANPFAPAAPPWPANSPPPPATGHIPSPFDFTTPPPPRVAAGAFPDLAAERHAAANPFAVPAFNAPPPPAAAEWGIPAFPFLQPETSAEPPFYGVQQLSQEVTAPPDPIHESAEPESPLVHEIPCPKGHILEAPHELLDQYVLCPVCNIRFRLRYEDSLAARGKNMSVNKNSATRKAAAFWLKVAIGLAVVVIAGLIFMIALANSK